VLSKKSTHRLQRTVLSTKSTDDSSSDTPVGSDVVVDSVLDANSENAIQNKAVTRALADIPKNTKNLIKNMLANVDYKAEDINSVEELAYAVRDLFAALKAGG